MIVKNADELVKFGRKFGASLHGGEVIELVGDVGAGKTTFAQGLAQGLGVTAPISSPSFSIMKSYTGRGGLILNHYDFYRLTDPGIMRDEIAESITSNTSITVIEWAENVSDVLPVDRRVIRINYLSDDSGREVIWS